MLSDDILVFFFKHFCFTLHDATRFLIACGLKPQGIYCHMLVRSYLRLELGFAYYKIRNYVPLLRCSGEHAVLQNLVLCDDRFVKHNKIIFHSPTMRVQYVTANSITLQDPTTFFHLRLRGFFCSYVRRTQNMYLKHFKKNFRFDNFVIKRFRPMHGTCYLSQDLYVHVSIAIQYDVVEQCFYPHVCDYSFLSR